MGFLNALLLLGALAFAVPLIIHLLNRSKFQTVEWGAMHLLESIELQNAKRIQWQALLLLLMRCAIPIILAICMARPIWNWWQGTMGRGAMTTAMILDNSYSMQAVGGASGNQEGTTNSLFDKSVSAARLVTDNVGGKSAKAVIVMGGEPHNLTEGTSYDARPVERQLTRLTATAPSLGPVSALQLAIDTLAKSPDPYRQLVLWSDFQRHDWEAIPEESWLAIKEQIDKMPVPASIHLLPLASEKPNNLYLTIESDLSEVSLTGEPIELRATVTNTGDAPLTGVPVTLRLDDREIAVKKLDLGANSQAQVSFLATVDQPGTHWAGMRVEDSGPIRSDDEDRLRIETVKPLKIVLVESRTDLPLLESQTGFLQIALQSTFRDDGKSLGVALERITPDRATTALVESADVLVLANVPRTSDEVAAAIAKRVTEGASLWIFGGDQIDRAWYQKQWGGEAKSVLLPYDYGEIRDFESEAAKNQNANTNTDADSKNKKVVVPKIVGGPYSDPALSLFNSPQQGRLDQVSIRRCHQLAIGKNVSSQPSSTDNAAVVLLKLPDSSPVLVKSNSGKGTVYQWAITANDTWSDFPVRPAYVPLVQRLLLFSHGAFEPHRTSQLRQESKHDPLSREEIKALAAKMNANVHDSVELFLKRETEQRFGQELWRWFLWGVVALLFGELFLEKRITRGER